MERRSDMKTGNPSWYYNEMVQVGADFTKREVVEAYDNRHRRFRDIDKENEVILAGLGLQSGYTLADIGCGTGALVLHAARRCARVHAVDISPAMLDYTGWKAQQQGLTNIDCHQGGFLTYVHAGPPLDAVSTAMALHHLPDFWKQKALKRINGMLKPGGRLYLADVVFSEENVETNIPAWIDKLTAQAGPEMTGDITRHIRQEYSTFAWILEGMLSRAGFRIDQVEYFDGVLARYFATKIKEINE